MKASFHKLFSLFLLFASLAAKSQIYDTNNPVVQTFAGSGFTGYLDGQGTLTMWNTPSMIVADISSNLFVWDSGNSRIRKILPDGTVSTYVGGGSGSFEGYGTNVWFSYSTFGRMAMDHLNSIWMVNSYFSTYLLRIGPDDYVSVQNVNLPGLSTSSGLCFDSVNNLYYTDARHIYRYFPSNSSWEVFVGSGNSGVVDGNGIFSSFNSAGALAADAADNIYVNDAGLIRRVNQNRDVVTIAGGGSGDGFGRSAAIGSVTAMCVDQSGNLIFTRGDYSGSDIRKMTATTNVLTIAGTATYPYNGYTNGPGNLARFSGASGVCVSQGMIFVTDSNNQRIRNIVFNSAPQQVLPADLSLILYPGLRISGTVGRTYRIESSPDMNSWNPETTIMLTRTPYLWFDEGAVGQKKFYRALLLP
jgi:hypothetical protein